MIKIISIFLKKNIESKVHLSQIYKVNLSHLFFSKSDILQIE
jgi:hypothetical protein